jgi:ribosome-binding ATPase YchF (GTP1/OBG family)
MANQNSSADNAARLDRIEEKIDRMSEAIIALARAEEKISNLTEISRQQAELIVAMETRIDHVESTVQSNTSMVNIINKIFWIIISAAAVSVTGMLWMQV